MRSLFSRRVLARVLAATLFLGVIVTAEPGRVSAARANSDIWQAPKATPKAAPKATVSFGAAPTAPAFAPSSAAAPAEMQAPPPIAATLRDSLDIDTNADGQPGPGDTVRYTATITAGATAATGVTYNAPLDANTTLVPGSVTATPVGVNDTYTADRDTALTTPAATGVLANDFGGLPAATVTAFQTPTPNGGIVAVAGDGGFTYTPAAGYTGPDSFTYTIGNGAGSDTATVSLDVRLAAAAVDDVYNVIKDVALSVPAPGLLANDGGVPAPAVTPAIAATAQGGSVTVNADGSFTYTPPAGFVSPPIDTFSYTITNSAGTSSATASLTVDARPAVDSSVPASGATNLAADANISVTFSEPVNLVGIWFRIDCTTSGVRHPTHAVVSGGPTTYTIDPTTNFTAGESCTATLFASQVRDQDATDPPDTPVADHVFTFSIDATPLVSGTSPVTGAIDIALNADLTVTFSEPVTVTGNWFQIGCSASGTRNVADTAVTTGDNATFTINPTANFVSADTCTATVFAAQISDTDGNDPPDAMTANHVFTFAMDAGPGVSSTIPVAGAISIATNTNLTIAFSEAVNVTGNWFQIVCATTGTRNVADTVVTGGPTYVINPNIDFAPGELCTTTVFAAQVNDQDANDPPDNLAANLVFAFTLEGAPSVVTTVPVNGAVTGTSTQNLTITFSEPVNVTGNWFRSCARAERGTRPTRW